MDTKNLQENPLLLQQHLCLMIVSQQLPPPPAEEIFSSPTWFNPPLQMTKERIYRPIWDSQGMKYQKAVYEQERLKSHLELQA